MVRKRPGEPARIFVNRDDHPGHQRFTIAHELGHLVKRRFGVDDEVNRIDWRDERAPSGTDPDETYADGFAAELLMPASSVRGLVGRVSMESMAQSFGVSETAMANRYSTLQVGLQAD